MVLTQDWHPPNHLSFASNHEDRAAGEIIELDGLQQVLWPDHCIENSSGAEFAAEIEVDKMTYVSRKGENPRIDSYSGFFDNGRRQATDLHAQLQAKGVNRLFVGGLATEYCVKFTVLDAISLGYETMLVTDVCRGLSDADSDAAIKEMQSAGAKLVSSQDLYNERSRPA